jgi:ribosomal protein L37AE/L43A
MGITHKYNKMFLSQTSADLLARAREREESSPDISRLRDEIIKDIERKDETFGKFRGLLESLSDVVPEEEKRYRAAIKALSFTSGLTRGDVLEAVDRRLSELKEMGKAFTSALPAWRADLKVMESKSEGIRNEISMSRKKMSQLEEEEREILDGMAELARKVELAENGIDGLLTDIAAEITGVKVKAEESVDDKISLPPLRPGDSFKNSRRTADIITVVPESSFQEASLPQDQNAEEWKKCPVCGGRAMWYLKKKVWKCYVCAHEESGTNEVDIIREKTVNLREHMRTRVRRPASSRTTTFGIPPEFSSGQKHQPVRTKPCPICKKKMDWHETEKSWRCPFCEYQRMEF